MICAICGNAVPELYVCGTMHDFKTCINCVVDLAGLALDYQEGAIDRVRQCSDEIGYNGDTIRAASIRRKHYGSNTGLKAMEKETAH